MLKISKANSALESNREFSHKHTSDFTLFLNFSKFILWPSAICVQSNLILFDSLQITPDILFTNSLNILNKILLLSSTAAAALLLLFFFYYYTNTNFSKTKFFEKPKQDQIKHVFIWTSFLYFSLLNLPYKSDALVMAQPVHSVNYTQNLSQIIESTYYLLTGMWFFLHSSTFFKDSYTITIATAYFPIFYKITWNICVPNRRNGSALEQKI